MKPVSGRDGGKGTSAMAAPLGIRWVRVLLAGVAVHVVGIVVSVVLIVAFSVVTVGAPVDRLAGLLSTWILPVLTLPAAAWVARGAHRGTAAPNGLLLGLLVAGLLSLLFFWPNDLPSIALFVLTIAAGFAGGLLGERKTPDPKDLRTF